MAGAAAVGIAYDRAASLRPRWLVLPAIAVGAALYGGSLLYAPAATVARTREGQEPGLDSLAYLERTDPGMAAAVTWVRANLSGDDVLLEVARRLVAAVPSHASVGRISGDEFVILDPHTETATQAVVLAERVLDSLREPLGMRQGDMFVSVSIGVASYPEHGEELSVIMNRADQALYQSKRGGRNRVHVD